MIIGGSKKEVIANIKKNIQAGELNKKVEVNDPNLSDEEFYKEVLTNYGHNVIEIIKREYQGLLPVETLNKLNNFKFK